VRRYRFDFTDFTDFARHSNGVFATSFGRGDASGYEVNGDGVIRLDLARIRAAKRKGLATLTRASP